MFLRNSHYSRPEPEIAKSVSPQFLVPRRMMNWRGFRVDSRLALNAIKAELLESNGHVNATTGAVQCETREDISGVSRPRIRRW